jgi:hypothetical protein
LKKTVIKRFAALPLLLALATPAGAFTCYAHLNDLGTAKHTGVLACRSVAAYVAAVNDEQEQVKRIGTGQCLMIKGGALVPSLQWREAAEDLPLTEVDVPKLGKMWVHSLDFREEGACLNALGEEGHEQ